MHRRPAGRIWDFAGEQNKPYSDLTFTTLPRRMGIDFTIHGFRSTFRDWSTEQTAFPREVCEAALAHVINDATEAPYFLSDRFEKRRLLMDAWAVYCATEKACGPGRFDWGRTKERVSSRENAEPALR